MNFFSTVLLGLAMSTDAFAAAIGKGAGMSRPRWRDALRIGAVFGAVEGLTPLVGWLLGTAANRFVRDWDHWVAFGLLSLLGLHMLYKALAGDGGNDAQEERRDGMLGIALTGLATSIDALAVGVGLAFVEVNIVVAAATIGLCTFAMVSIGIMAGRALGRLFGKRAEIAGGLILIAVGAAILYEHLSGAAG
ncbi:MAG: manganese efflux pump MntP family protein [Pseudoxanthomonas sp.]